MRIHEFELKINDSILKFPETEINRDCIIGIFGASGSGKTTLIQYLYETLSDTSVRYMKQDVIMHPDLTVTETLVFYEKMRSNNIENIDNVLTKMDMKDLADAKIGSFEDKIISGGEKKRVIFASILLDHVDVFLLDEPFSGLDSKNIHLLFDLLMKKKKESCIIFTVHEFPSELMSQLDNIWELTCGLQDISFHKYTSEKIWQQIELHEEYAPSLPKSPTTIITKFKTLLHREYLIRKRNPIATFAKFIVPLFTIAIQNFLIGRLFSLKREWLSHDDGISFYKMILNFNIVVFTASIIPISFLTDHFQQKLVVHHEISQGFYPQNLYIWSMLIIDHLLLLCTSCIVTLISMPSRAFF